jgi:hypothetical protein
MMRKVMVAMLLVALVATSGSATFAAARALPPQGGPYDAKGLATIGSSTNDASPTRAAHWGRMHRRLLSLEESKKQPGPSCGTHDDNIGCP